MTMENPIDCRLKSLRMLSLEDISLRKLAVLLLTERLKYMNRRTVQSLRGGRKVLSNDEHLKNIAIAYGLPESMWEPLVNMIYPICQELFKWATFHEQFLMANYSTFHNPEYIKRIHWTYMGTINYQKTAEAMIRDESWNNDKRFMFACLYCLEEDIQDLWRKLPPLSKNGFSSIGQPSGFGLPREIVVFWTCILKGRVDKLESFLMEGSFSSIYQYAFESFAPEGYETATQYFFEKLTFEEKDTSLVRTTKTVAGTAGPFFGPCFDVACYLLCQMNEEQLQNILESSCYQILRIFMDWPRQGAFSEVAKLALPYFTKDDYELLHIFLSRRFKCIYNAPKLFRDLLLIGPKDFSCSFYYINDFFISKDTENIQFIFRNMDPAETLELVLNIVTLQSCHMLVKEGEWEFLEFFIRESRLSKKDRERFARQFNLYLASRCVLEIRERFTKMMNDISAGTSDRDFSNHNKINQTDSMDSQPTGPPDEDLVERPAKKNKKI